MTMQQIKIEASAPTGRTHGRKHSSHACQTRAMKMRAMTIATDPKTPYHLLP